MYYFIVRRAGADVLKGISTTARLAYNISYESTFTTQLQCRGILVCLDMQHILTATCSFLRRVIFKPILFELYFYISVLTLHTV